MLLKITSALLTIASLSLPVSTAPVKFDEGLSLVILHNNDMHGRFEETARNSGTCQPKKKNLCVGGFARTAEVIRNFRQAADAGTSPPVLYLNAGDTFTGTSWFSVFTWNISSAFVNALKPDVVALGNHEFDLTPQNLAKFVNAVNAPFVAANLDMTNETVLSKVQKSVVLQIQGYQVGVVGYLTPETVKISLVGNVKFQDEVEAIRKEAQKLTDEGVDIIIALGHSGYEMDKRIAKEVAEVDIVVGGHTNTFLWNGEQPDAEAIEGPYPKIMTQASGKKVPVVQAYAYTKYLGVLNVTFDTTGKLVELSGQPLFLDSSVNQQPDVLELLEVYRPAIDELNNEKVGVSKVTLDGSSSVCRQQECNLGNLAADIHVSYVASVSTDRWTNAPIGIYNGGGIRNTIIPDENSNEVTRGDLLGSFPFGNQVIVITLNGSDLLYALEQMVRSQGETSGGEFPQVSGLRLVLDMSEPPYSRVKEVRVRCGLCDIPSYDLLDVKKNYTLVTSSFLSEGGDGITTFKEKAMNKKVQDLGDLDMIVWYFNNYSPLYPEIQDRIVFVNKGSKSAGVKSKDSFTTVIIGLIISQLLWRLGT
ncbi:protein 5NUC-like [Rhynchophorus ferrugineus]|uniref:Uncharacterized protein n=1 Tax=Rhynchophorus ferrugineus TaxID=354439 RepID=A0A834MKT7_RHYFE|nr:hypothetical protein GWI33_003883 [Rhynchophorus ferrugineus]